VNSYSSFLRSGTAGSATERKGGTDGPSRSTWHSYRQLHITWPSCLWRHSCRPFKSMANSQLEVVTNPSWCMSFHGFFPAFPAIERDTTVQSTHCTNPCMIGSAAESMDCSQMLSDTRYDRRQKPPTWRVTSDKINLSRPRPIPSLWTLYA